RGGAGAHHQRERGRGGPARGPPRLRRVRHGIPRTSGARGGGMKGEKVLINGDLWMIVDVAPAMPLAEMVATILEDEGMITIVRGAENMADALSHLGLTSAQATYVLVPEADGA